MQTVTFTSKCKNLTLTTKKEFLEKCPNPSEHDNFDLATKFNVVFYLHNDSGPAIIDHFNKDYAQYWINGEPLNGTNEGEELIHKPEELERMRYTESYETDLSKVLDKA